MNAPELCLDVPIEEAVLFALGFTDLDLHEPSDHGRQVIGLIALDHLEYAEQWRVSAMLRSALKEKWPELDL